MRVLLAVALLAPTVGCPGEVEKKFEDSAPYKLDSGAGTDGSYTAAGPCPCKTGYECIVSTCRKKCTEQTCNGAGVCSVDESCIKQGTKKTPVCTVGAGKGMPCDTATPCKSGHLCLSTSTSGSTGKCYPTCSTAGTPCVTGGMCYNTPAGGCRYCYP